MYRRELQLNRPLRVCSALLEPAVVPTRRTALPGLREQEDVAAQRQEGEREHVERARGALRHHPHAHAARNCQVSTYSRQRMGVVTKLNK